MNQLMLSKKEWSTITSYTRLPGETDDQLIYRVTKDKDLIGSWNDVADVLNELLGTHYGESKFRKDKATFDRMLNANRDMFVDSDKQLQDIRIAQRELEKLVRKSKQKN